MKRKLLYSAFMLCMFCTSQAQLGKMFGKKKETADTTKKTEAIKTTETDQVATTDTAATEEKKGKKGSSGFFTKLLVKGAVAAGSLSSKIMGGDMFGSTDDLGTVDLSGGYRAHLYPGDLGTAEMALYSDWKTSGSQIMFIMTKKEGVGINSIKGSVNIDGKPMKKNMVGIYTYFTEDNSKSHKVEITTDKGQKSTFNINPPKYNVKVLSINGSKAESVNIDPTKDVVLELYNPPGSENTMLTINLLYKIISVPTFTSLGMFKSANKITIPAAYFRNVDGAGNYKNSYFSVERASFEQATDVSGFYPTVNYGTLYSDGKYINFSPDIDANNGIIIKSTVKNFEGKYNEEFTKANALQSMSFNQIKNIGVLSFGVVGSLQNSASKTKYSGNDSYTTSSINMKFPQLPNEEWDEVLNNLYKKLTKVLTEEFNAPIVPQEKITSSKGYERLVYFSKDDKNTEAVISRGYKGLNIIGFTSLTEESGGTTAASPNNSTVALMQESGANAILKVKLEMAARIGKSWGSYDGSFVPTLYVELIGNKPGYQVTKYFTTSIEGSGYDGGSKKEKFDLAKACNIDDLVKRFQADIQEAKRKEKEIGDYNIIWDNKL
ncbi:MAG: hypothetical protein H7101_04480 [Deinococcales bacterium]|nr:hypothetical protein [Chitinophagaceae bacterium]